MHTSFLATGPSVARLDVPPDMADARIVVARQVAHSEQKTAICLDDGSVLNLQPHLYVRDGDRLRIYGEVAVDRQPDMVEKLVRDDDAVLVWPPYHVVHTINLAPHRVEVHIRERLSAADWRQARLLERFHYRGQGLNRIVGRRGVLVAESPQYGFLGYGVLSSALPAAAPRFELLSTSFSQQMRDKTINKIVRIPRIVVHPEFRGMGVGVLIAEHLAEFARERWDVSGFRPVIVEVIAAMTEYHRFFETAGFLRVGDTTGYKEGVRPRYGASGWETRPNADAYNFLQDQKPKPYLVCPLNKEMRDRATEMARRAQHGQDVSVGGAIRPKARLQSAIKVNKVSVHYEYGNGLTERGKRIRQDFGVSPDQMSSFILNRLTLRIDPGDMLLVTGASGCGKSTLLKLLSLGLDAHGGDAVVDGEVAGIRPEMVEVLDVSNLPDIPLIEQVGGSVESAVHLLNSVGLAEAHLYLKRPSQISEGQRYRFAIARLCESGRPVWVADEFVSTLDPLNAALAARGLRKLAYRVGATAILAAPHIDHFLGSLLPSRLVRLRWGAQATVSAVHLGCARSDGELRMAVRNTGPSSLNDVEVGFTTAEGGIEPRWTCDKLRPGGSRTTQIGVGDAPANAVAAYVHTAEGVGDMILLR